MHIILRYFSIAAAVTGLFFASCNNNKPDPFANVKGTYFSIKKFAVDEWTTHAGEPISFTKTVKLNDKTDSSVTNIEHIDWAAVIDIFAATDISDRKFLGQYTYNEIDDSFNRTHDFIYMANDKDLFTQKLLISMDMYTHEVKGVYVETFKSTFWNKRQQKLLYSPVKTIQIQQYDMPLIGAKKELVIKYKAI